MSPCQPCVRQLHRLDRSPTFSAGIRSELTSRHSTRASGNAIGRRGNAEFQKIGVGIIGVQAGRSFAAIAHIPALKALPQYEIAAISTTRIESAEAAAQEYGIPRGYDNHAALVAIRRLTLSSHGQGPSSPGAGDLQRSTRVNTCSANGRSATVSPKPSGWLSLRETGRCIPQ